MGVLRGVSITTAALVFGSSIVEKFAEVRSGTAQWNAIVLANGMRRAAAPMMSSAAMAELAGLGLLFTGLRTVGAMALLVLLSLYSVLALRTPALAMVDVPCNCTRLDFFEVAGHKRIAARNCVLAIIVVSIAVRGVGAAVLGFSATLVLIGGLALDRRQSSDA